jgi:phage FluMu protein Com
MKCPKCDGEMEHGYLQIGASVGFGVFWFDRLFEHGEQFAAGKERLITAFPPRNIEGFRCPNCKIVVFEYGKEGRKKESDTIA